MSAPAYLEFVDGRKWVLGSRKVEEVKYVSATNPQTTLTPERIISPMSSNSSTSGDVETEIHESRKSTQANT